MELDLSTPESTLAAVHDMDEDTRQRLRTALAAHRTAVEDANIAADLRVALERLFPGQPVAAVFFDTMEWDNGYFLSDYAEVYFADGEVASSVEIGIADQLTDAYGARGATFVLGIDPNTGRTEHDDYGHDVYERFGLEQARAVRVGPDA